MAKLCVVAEFTAKDATGNQLKPLRLLPVRTVGGLPFMEKDVVRKSGALLESFMTISTEVRAVVTGTPVLTVKPLIVASHVSEVLIPGVYRPR